MEKSTLKSAIEIQRLIFQLNEMLTVLEAPEIVILAYYPFTAQPSVIGYSGMHSDLIQLISSKIEGLEVSFKNL